MKKNQQQKITFYTVTKSHKLFICEGHFTVDQIYVYSSRKLLKEGALPTLNLPHPSANANATNNRSKIAIKSVKSKCPYKSKCPNFHHQMHTFHLKNSSNGLKILY